MAIIVFVWKAGQQYKDLTAKIESNGKELREHSIQIKGMERTLGNLVTERRTDMGFLRAQLACTMPMANGPCKILLVDDSNHDREIFKRMLSPFFTVEEANSLEEANDRFTYTKFDCVLLDLNLPDSLAGSTVNTFLDAHPGALCVVLTGSVSESAHSAALADGAEMILMKDGAEASYVTRVIHDAIIKKRLMSRQL